MRKTRLAYKWIALWRKSTEATSSQQSAMGNANKKDLELPVWSHNCLWKKNLRVPSLSSKGTFGEAPKDSTIQRLTKQPAVFAGRLNSPKTKMINGIMLVVFPRPFVQASLWRCNLETTDRIVVPGAWVPNGCTAVAFWGLGFGKFKALLRKPGHQHLLGLIANSSQAIPLFEPHDSFTNSYS